MADHLDNSCAFTPLNFVLFFVVHCKTTAIQDVFKIKKDREVGAQS